LLDRSFVEVQRVAANVREDDGGAAKRNAPAVGGKLNDGTTTSSPGPTSSSRAAISSAAVAPWVRSAVFAPVRCSSQSQQRRVNGPFPDRCRLSIASRRYSNSAPVANGRLKGTLRIELVCVFSRTISPGC